MARQGSPSMNISCMFNASPHRLFLTGASANRSSLSANFPLGQEGVNTGTGKFTLTLLGEEEVQVRIHCEAHFINHVTFTSYQ